MQGEQNNLDSPCKFTRIKEHKLCNPPNKLTYPKANYVLLVFRSRNKEQNILFMSIFVLHFCFGLNFQCVLFWFYIFGIVNHIAILAMLVVTLWYTPSSLLFFLNSMSFAQFQFYILILKSYEILLPSIFS